MPDPTDRLNRALGDRYHVDRTLGQGGMATVYLAVDVRHHRQVAIKVLRPELAAALGTERFLREIETTAQLSHPHILPLYDSGVADGLLYYVMPLVEGESLRSRLAREKQLPLEDALQITRQVADALSYAHSRGVVHRDVKPENILLSGEHALVADFGIARAIAPADAQRLTDTGIAIGTPAYMSPEQVTGAGNVDARSDQYSLACVLYELLVGEPPFTGPTAHAVMARHSLGQVSPPSIVRQNMPEGVELALLKALAKTPADRFATAHQFAQALGVGLRTSGVPQRRPPRTRRVGFPRLDWRLALGLAALALAGGWGWRHLPWNPATRAAELPDPTQVAVLYFNHRGDFQGAQYLADGLTEELIHELARVNPLHVISANGVRAYRNTTVTPDSIGRALHVRTIVQGTLAQAQHRVRLDVSLIDASSNTEIGSTSLEARRGDLFALQDTLARSVAFFLRRTLGREIQLQRTRMGTTNQAAWELLEQAEELRRDVRPRIKAGDTAAASAELAQADTLLAHAAALDRRWPDPIVARGWLAYDRQYITGLAKGPADDWTMRGLALAEEALRVAPNDPEAKRLRGTMRYMRYLLNLGLAPFTAEQLLAAAEQDLRAASVPENSNRPAALALLSHLLYRKGATAEGKLAALQAYETDPYLTVAPELLYRLAMGSIDLDDAAEATKWCLEGRRRFPHDPSFAECQLDIYAMHGQHPDIARVWQMADEDVSLYPPNERAFHRHRDQMMVAMALARAGLDDSARSVALRARADATIDPAHELPYLEAMLRNMLGDRDEALHQLSIYLATNPQDRETLAADSTWWWDGLRNDPRFQALVRRGR